MFLFFEQDKFAPGAKSIQSEILAKHNSIRKPYQPIITILPWQINKSDQ